MAQLRNSFSIVKEDERYRIKCNDTSELVTGRIASKKQAQEILLNHIDTKRFIESSKNMTPTMVKKRVALFDGRLRPVKKPWTIEEARLVAKLYKTRGELFNRNKKLYHCAYQKGWLDEICSHMASSRKKNKFTYGVLNPNTALAKIFDYPTHHQFAIENNGAYDALRRFGVDTVELFENRDNALYLQGIIKKLASEQVEKFIS